MKEVLRIAFDKAGAKPVGRSCNAFIRAILRDHPELSGETVYFPEQGGCGYTAIIGDLVFKAARMEPHSNGGREEEVEIYRRALERERKILRHLKGKGLPVPEFVAEGNDPPYFCMKRCTGLKLEPDALQAMTQKERRQIAKDLTGFMAGLAKAFSAGEAKNMGLVNSPTDEEYCSPEKFRTLLIDPAVAKALGDNFDFCCRMQTEFAKRYEEDHRNKSVVVSHGDLKWDNIFYDPATKRISGKGGCVIDFGLCRYSRPVSELNFLSCFYKDDFIAKVCEEYSKLAHDSPSFRDVKVMGCARLVVAVKQSLESEDEKWRKRLPEVLKEIADIKASLAPRAKSRPKNPLSAK